jgi:hypothetical protein
MRLSRLVSAPLAIGCVLGFGACAAQTTPPKEPVAAVTAVPTATATAPVGTVTARPAPDPFALPPNLAAEALPPAVASPPPSPSTLAPPPKALPKLPAVCGPYLKRTKTKATSAACADRSQALALLANALEAKPAGALSAAESADTALAALERCAGLPTGTVRAVRAELAPSECGDAIVADAIPTASDPFVRNALHGLALAARLARLGSDPPTLAPPYDLPRVDAFHKKEAGTWMRAQASMIGELGAQSEKLEGYGRALAGVEAGRAYLRVVEAIRGIPIPDLFAKDERAREDYYVGLDVALDPYKSQGTKASLVALGGFAAVGDTSSPRAAAARASLTQAYGGRKLDALDRLLVPVASASAATSVEARLAARLPTFWAGLLLPADVTSRSDVLAAFAERGVPLWQRIGLQGRELSAAESLSLARARFALFRWYWRRVDADELVRAAARVPADQADGRFFLALGLALRGGPAHAGELLAKAPIAAIGIGDVKALDSLSSAGGPHAALAAFDTAFVLTTAPPAGASAAYHLDVAKRFEHAATLLSEPAATRARELATDARAVAKFIETHR